MAEDTFIQLNRTFRIVSEEEIDSDNSDSEYDLYTWGLCKKTGWDVIEQRFRSVILAEGGAGKTREMKQRCNFLREEGMSAWFIELEMLAGDDRVEDLIAMNPDLNPSEFTDWRDSSREPGWLFLDAVDELKLKDGDLKRALYSLRKSIGAAHDRIHIIISCRPSDWDKIDIRYFTDQLPAPRVSENSLEAESRETADDSSEDRFLAPLKGSRGIKAKDDVIESAGEKIAQPEELKIFQLETLTRNQVKDFALNHSPDVSDPLLKAVEEHDRWAFTRQPQDLIELLALWREKKSLGSLKRQHEAFLISSLRERDGRPGEVSQLSQQKAREGAERLALSLALSKKRTLLNVSEETSVGSCPASVCPRELLRDWSSPDIKALLRLRTFDPPSYGRIKFHRRDLQEYLAAGRLINLARAGNDSMKKLCALLFSKDPSGQEIMLPTMKGIAVWVASDSSEFGSRVRSRLIEIEPELLLVNGDPEHLPVPSKITILNQIVKFHTEASRRSLSYSPATLKRFAAPELAQTITNIFESGDRTDSLATLLLSLVKDGKIENCSEMLKKVAMESQYPSHWRALAVMGLISCNQDEYLGEVVHSILESPQKWPDTLLAQILDDIVPKYLSVEQLKSVLEAIAQRADAAYDEFIRPMQRMAEMIAGRSGEVTELKSTLASLILSHQNPGSVHYHPDSRWSSLAPSLQMLILDWKGSEKINQKSKEHYFDCLTAIIFQPERYYGASLIDKLVEHVSTIGIERKLLYQWELEYVVNNFPTKNNEAIVMHYSLARGFTVEDISWLEELVKSEDTDIRIRLSALLERIRLWNSQGRPQEEEARLRSLGNNDPIIEGNVNAYLSPREPSDAELEWEEMRRKRESEEKKRLEGWQQWRDDIVRDPQDAFSGEGLARSRYLILDWLMADNGRSGSYQLWDGGKGVAAAFSEEVRGAVASTFIEYWRNLEVKTYSEQEGDRSSTPYSWIYALTGVTIESETPGWVTRLSDDEVRQAIRIAMIEINGLASYAEQLIHDRPEPVKEVLSQELSAQWSRRFEVSYLPLLQNVTNGSPSLRSLLLDVCINLLLEWSNPSDLTDEAFTWANHNLSQLLGIIQSCWEDVTAEQRRSLQSFCVGMLEKQPKSRFSVKWLRLIFYIDLDTAIEQLDRTIKAQPSSRQKDGAVYLFSNLFGDGYQPDSINLVGNSPSPRSLSRLILIAYTYVVPAEDKERPENDDTPSSRSEAEYARSSLVNLLIGIDGPVADQEIERLAASAECSSIAEYLRSRQKVRIEKKADRGYSISEILDIETRFETVPQDRDSLFRVMMARLEDLQDFLDTDDFVPLLTLQRIDSEEEMQRAIAMLLKHASNGVYEILRETEVKDRKRTDIQFCISSSNVQSVIEIKVGEKPAWTVKELLNEALEDQLVNRYLLQGNRKAGCLLITYGGHVSECPECGKTVRPRAKWKDPGTGKYLDFEGLIELLRVRAKGIVEEHDGEICLEVFGLDLRNPSLRKTAGS